MVVGSGGVGKTALVQRLVTLLFLLLFLLLILLLLLLLFLLPLPPRFLCPDYVYTYEPAGTREAEEPTVAIMLEEIETELVFLDLSTEDLQVPLSSEFNSASVCTKTSLLP